MPWARGGTALLTSLRQRVTGWLRSRGRRVTPPPGATPVRDDLWAIWPYDQFPFYLCAQVECFTEDGRVHVKGYGGYVFRPVTVLHGKGGEDFRAYLTAASTVYRDMQDCMRNACGDELVAACKLAHVPSPPNAWRSGFRGYGMGDAFNRGIAEVLGGNAPAFSYGGNAKGEPI